MLHRTLLSSLYFQTSYVRFTCIPHSAIYLLYLLRLHFFDSFKNFYILFDYFIFFFLENMFYEVDLDINKQMKTYV